METTIRRGGFEWRVLAVDGDRVFVEAVGYGIKREWTRADLLPPQVDHDPVDDVGEDER